MAAVDQLTQLSAWAGTDDEKKLAVSRATNLKILLQEFTESCGDMANACCYDRVERRLNENGQLEINVNDTGWVLDTTDPRLSIPTMPPITLDETHTKCDAATNALGNMQDVVSKYANSMEQGADISELAIAVLGIIFLFLEVTLIGALLTPLLIAIAAALIRLTRAEFEDYFTSDVWHEVLCAAYCTIGDNGQFNNSQFLQFIGKLKSGMDTGVGKDIFINTVKAAGVTQVNNWCSQGESASADCSDCDCVTFCDYSAWEIHGGRGTIIDQDASGITVQATLLSGAYYVDIDSGDVDSCCCEITFDNIVGEVGDSRTIWYNPCGLAYTDDTNLNFSYSGQSANRLGIATDHPFTVRIFSTGDCA
jgi:hypothetical protein